MMIPFRTIDHALYLVLALIIAALASYVMFSMIARFKKSRSHRVYWLMGASTVFAVGAWSMHSVSMLAYHDVAVIVTGTQMIVPLFLSGGSTYFALTLLIGRRENPSMIRQLSAALLLTSGAVMLHFLCMLSHSANHLQLDPFYAGSAFLCFLGPSFAAFFLYQKHADRFRLLSCLLIAVGALAMHLLMIAGTQFYSSLSMEDYRLDDYMLLMGLLMGSAIIIIISFSIVTWIADRRYGLINERYRLLVENSIDMIAVISGTSWEFVNRSGLRMFEITEESHMVGRSIFEFLHPDHKERLNLHLQRHQAYKSIKKTGCEDGPAIELDWVTRTGKLINTELILSESTFAGKSVVVIIRDISERKKNEELLINSEKLYVAGQLAAGIAHEIRNPLTSLKGFLQLIASGRTSASGYYDIMKSELNRVETIVSELLMLSKPQVYEMDIADARCMMLDTVLLLESQAALYGIVVKVDYGEEPLWIYGVDSQIKQVFINVLKNGIEVMQDGGEIEIVLRREGEEVLISVTDMGPGIEEEQLAKIGQPFYTTKDKGTGLGLMVSYKIVDNHKGRIRVESKLGTGTTFEIQLPYRNHSARSDFKGASGENASIG
ncbi:ATP-binding protein [Paenibacillus herberti]|uniref:histidine kinase n=1 Tax=Paenibacillus herberti TaxID=1619309 RepID=A0A229NWP7_9BACL|nr:ATP-binding protein [Paenibacillus herberti]OXM14079.1 hypothetical protein CGZ75_13910 [Paenibacillus herberti]